MKTKTNEGFAGLLALLITVAIISVLIFKTNFVGNTNKGSVIESGKSAIDSAEAIKIKLEQENKRAVGVE